MAASWDHPVADRNKAIAISPDWPAFAADPIGGCTCATLASSDLNMNPMFAGLLKQAVRLRSQGVGLLKGKKFRLNCAGESSTNEDPDNPLLFYVILGVTCTSLKISKRVSQPCLPQGPPKPCQGPPGPPWTRQGPQMAQDGLVKADWSFILQHGLDAWQAPVGSCEATLR
ncbi:hypothetical protein M513_05637 [Trichuris suis]|uniref:Uncharacterized protein n=1 Tax=Trichuris suis TaxID=68888 RepID=A0A085M8I5_9BILA|nr:hypothetical protein M513_05637 [Trichuris suis]